MVSHGDSLKKEKGILEIIRKVIVGGAPRI
jgi:hypothetical protein